VLSLALFAVHSFSQDIQEAETQTELILSFREKWQREEYLFKLHNAPFITELSVRPKLSEDYISLEASIAPKPDPKFDERFRIGIAADADKPEEFWVLESRISQRDWGPQWKKYSDYDWLERRLGFEAKLYLFIRGQFDFCTLKLRYPLAQSHNGESWPYLAEIEDAKLYLRKGSINIALVGNLLYHSEYGFDSCFGLSLERKNLVLQLYNQGFAVTYTFSLGDSPASKSR